MEDYERKRAKNPPWKRTWDELSESEKSSFRYQQYSSRIDGGEVSLQALLDTHEELRLSGELAAIEALCHKARREGRNPVEVYDEWFDSLPPKRVD